MSKASNQTELTRHADNNMSISKRMNKAIKIAFQNYIGVCIPLLRRVKLTLSELEHCYG
jgi:7-cyano-7-deazaguanine synthase in queuosine biosynthesis